MLSYIGAGAGDIAENTENTSVPGLGLIAAQIAASAPLGNDLKL